MSSVPWSSVLTYALVAVAVLILISWFRMFVRRRRQLKMPHAVRVEREPTCSCGYPLKGITIPRCPECGRAVGFDKTFEELGINVQDVERHIERKRGRRQSS